MKTFLTIETDEKLKKEIKMLAVKFNCSLRTIVQKALIDLLKKNGVENPIEELK